MTGPGCVVVVAVDAGKFNEDGCEVALTIGGKAGSASANAKEVPAGVGADVIIEDGNP